MIDHTSPQEIHHDLDVLFYVGFVVVTTVAAWITAYRMRRRMKRALGKDVSDVELTSISTWMKVAESERNTKEGQHGGSLGPPL
jgi:hypothetical protein